MGNGGTAATRQEPGAPVPTPPLDPDADGTIGATWATLAEEAVPLRSAAQRVLDRERFERVRVVVDRPRHRGLGLNSPLALALAGGALAMLFVAVVLATAGGDGWSPDVSAPAAADARAQSVVSSHRATAVSRQAEKVQAAAQARRRAAIRAKQKAARRRAVRRQDGEELAHPRSHAEATTAISESTASTATAVAETPAAPVPPPAPVRSPAPSAAPESPTPASSSSSPAEQQFGFER